MVFVHEGIKLFFEFREVFGFNVVSMALCAGKKDDDLLTEGQRNVLFLLEDFRESLAAVDAF